MDTPAGATVSGDYAGIAQQLAAEVAEQRAQLARDRALVLAQPDIAKRLTEAPLGYARPEQWNGFVPPEIWNGARNDSPRRAALLEIIDDAQKASA
jgi:hypothetical protein